MIKLYNKYKAFRDLRHIRDNMEFKGEVFSYSDDWLRRVKVMIEYFDNNVEMRKIVADILRKFRDKCPYVPQYKEARKLYEEYFEMKNHIPNFDNLKKGDYVVKFRPEAPVKGKRFAEYWVNSSWPAKERTYKIKSKDNKWKYYKLELDLKKEKLSKDFLTSYRYATETEIKQYEKDVAEYNKIQSEIDKTFKEIGKLQKKRDEIF